MPQNQKTNKVLSQGVASYVAYLKSLRIAEITDELRLLLGDESNQLALLMQRKTEALGHLNEAEETIKQLIVSNRGGEKGLHGFIAEFAEVGVFNAKKTFEGLKASARVLNNNGPVDININNQDYQVKFYNNLLSELDTGKKYMDMKMLFPKDHVALYEKVMNGENNIIFQGNHLSESKIQSIKQRIEEISDLRGESMNEWMTSSQLDYRDVQVNKINETLMAQREDITKQAKFEQRQIKEETQQEREQLMKQAKNQPKDYSSFAEASKVAAVGAGLQGGVKFISYVYKKQKEGQPIWRFDKREWRELGLETLEGGVKGGFSGYAIYGLTNICQFSAPSAGAITSGTYGLVQTVISYRMKKIDADEFAEQVTLNALDASGAAIGAALGQTLIPIPVVGALVGSIALTSALDIGEKILNKQEQAQIQHYLDKFNQHVATLDIHSKQTYQKLTDQFQTLGKAQDYAFDFSLNEKLRWEYSIEVGRLVGVKEDKLLKHMDEIDAYFMG